MTTNLALAMAYATGEGTELDPDDLEICEGDGLYVAQVDGQALVANIEIDEDELTNLYHKEGFYGLSESASQWLNYNYSVGIGKNIIRYMPKDITYELLDKFPNIAHYATTPVTAIYKWSEGDEGYRENLAKSMDQNKPIGAKVLQ